MILRIGNNLDPRALILDARCLRESPACRQAGGIQNRVSRRGFTLIEVMVTTAILSLGVVLVYSAFFISLDSFNYCSDYLAAAPWMDEKIWQAQEQLSSQGGSAFPPGNGQLKVNNKEFNWYLKCVSVMGAQDLFKIDLVLSWQQARKNKKISRAAYAIYTKE